MNLASDWHGRTLQAALNEQPSLSLDFYSYGVLMRKREGNADDLAFAHAMIEEADELIRDGFAGLDFLNRPAGPAASASTQCPAHIQGN